MARLFGQDLGDTLGQRVVIENKPGAGGAIGMVYAAKQPADGYTFTIGTPGLGDHAAADHARRRTT